MVPPVLYRTTNNSHLPDTLWYRPASFVPHPPDARPETPFAERCYRDNPSYSASRDGDNKAGSGLTRSRAFSSLSFLSSDLLASATLDDMNNEYQATWVVSIATPSAVSSTNSPEKPKNLVPVTLPAQSRMAAKTAAPRLPSRIPKPSERGTSGRSGRQIVVHFGVL